MDGMEALDAVEALRLLAERWLREAEPLTFHGESYDSAEEERDEAVATTLREKAYEVLALIDDDDALSPDDQAEADAHRNI